jgi:O-antigen/teichoic acid export membrane protein
VLADLVATPVATAVLVVAALAATGSSYLGLRRITQRNPVNGPAEDLVRRVLRNSAIPILSQLFIRFADLAVAIVLLRLLGPEGNGRYALAVVVWLYVKTVSDFGLTLLTTRDVARDTSSAGRLLGTTTLLRLGILGLSALPVGAYVFAGLRAGTLSSEGALAIGLLYLSIVPGSFAEAANSVLNGYERMEVAAGINIGVSLARAPLAIVLAATALGVVGVALAALATATLSAHLFALAVRRITHQRTVWRLDWPQAHALLRASWPLLVNALLVNLFFRVDVFLVQAFRGDAALGIYDASYKIINLVTVIPAYTTLAIFPTLAQRGHDPQALRHTYRIAAYLLVWIAWGLVTVVAALAGTALHVLAGEQFLPEAATLLRLLIWFAPLSFLNGVIQYVLIAADLQRRVVPVFLAAVLFNFTGNLLLIPLYGARAAAVLTVLTEVVILATFYVVTRGTAVRPISRDALSRLWRPTAAGASAALLAIGLAFRASELLAACAGLLLFALASWVFRVVGPEEASVIRRAVRRQPRVRTLSEP